MVIRILTMISLLCLLAATAHAEPDIKIPPGFVFHRVFQKCDECPVRGFELLRPNERITCVLGTQMDLDHISVTWEFTDGVFENYFTDENKNICLMSLLKPVPAGGDSHAFWRFDHNIFYLNSDCVDWKSAGEAREKTAVAYKELTFRFNTFFNDYAPEHVRYLISQKPDVSAKGPVFLESRELASKR